ncbi:hypothetical protein IW150_007726, partial [Coemansia sp. RSA 2607]
MSDQGDELDFLYEETDEKDVNEPSNSNSPKDNTDAIASEVEMAEHSKDTENSSDDSDTNDDNDSDKDSDSDSGSDSDDDLQVILEHGGENSAGQTNSTNPTTTGGTDGQGDSIDDGNKSKSGDGGIQALFAGGVDRMDVLTVPLLQGMD